MKITSAEANKLLKKLNDEYAALLNRELRSKEFNAAMGEDVESVRPEYDYGEVQTSLKLLEAKIRRVKHALNIFNTTSVVEGFDMTVDEMLIYIPQLTKRKAKLADMNSKLPKERVADTFGRSGSIIDYVYTNYDLDKVREDYEAVTDELSRAQLALDILNNSAQIEVEI